MPKIVSYLKGGLGNQLFQYATARALALDNKVELILDSRSGFIRDYQYRRNYELNNFAINARLASPWERLPVWFYRLKNRLIKQPLKFKNNYFNTQFLFETQKKYLSKLHQTPIKNSTWLDGYWQSPLYFEHHKKLLLNELEPPKPHSTKILDLGKKIRSAESVAIGIRLYEESLEPLIHAKNRRAKTVFEINEALNKVRIRCPNANFYVFCTHPSKFLDQLDLTSDNTTLLTHDNGHEKTLDRLWLLSQCKNHLFNNSSFYWWGAWLSQANYNNSKQIIFAADNFINQDSIPKGWEIF